MDELMKLFANKSAPTDPNDMPLFLVLGLILRCSIPVTERELTRIVLLPSRIKRWGLYHIA